jgi:drug/metabolite transporter (DMT)-like permease
MSATAAAQTKRQTMGSVSGRWRLGLSLALLTCLFWATLPVALRVSLEVMDPWTLTWFRFACAAVFTLLLLGARGQLRQFSGLGQSRWLWLVLAAIGLIGNYLLYVLGLKFTTPANAQLLIQSAPLMLALGSVYFFKESIAKGQIVGFCAIAIGLLLFASEQRTSATQASHYGLGFLLIFLAAISWAVYALVQKRLLGRLSSQQIMLAMYAVASISLLPLANFSVFAKIDAFHAWAIAYCALNTIGAYGAFAEAMAHWDASRVSAVLACTPILTVVFVSLLAPLMPEHLSPERIGLLGWIGAAFVVGGSICASLLKNPNLLKSRRTGDTANKSRRTGDTANKSRRSGDTENKSKR